MTARSISSVAVLTFALGMMSAPASAETDLCLVTGDKSPIEKRAAHCTASIRKARREKNGEDLIHALVSRCHVYRFERKLDLAKKDCEEALALHNDNLRESNWNAKSTEHRVYAARGALFSTMGQYDLALKDENAAVDSIDHAADFYAYIFNNRAITYKALGQFDLALDDLNQAIRLDRKFLPAYVNRGIEYQRRGQTALAKADFERALTLPAGDFDFGHDNHVLARKRLEALAGR